MIAEGDALPAATLLRKGDTGVETIDLQQRIAGRRVVLFGVPGAFTPTCDSAHLPSFVRTAADFAAKGVDEILCVSVNDVHVLRRWEDSTGAAEAGITMLSDGDGAFVAALGLSYSNPAFAMFGRSRRFAMRAEDGVVRTLHVEDSPGQCTVTAGEALLATF